MKHIDESIIGRKGSHNPGGWKLCFLDYIIISGYNSIVGDILYKAPNMKLLRIENSKILYQLSCCMKVLSVDDGFFRDGKYAVDYARDNIEKLSKKQHSDKDFWMGVKTPDGTWYALVGLSGGHIIIVQ